MRLPTAWPAAMFRASLESQVGLDKCRARVNVQPSPRLRLGKRPGARRAERESQVRLDELGTRVDIYLT